MKRQLISILLALTLVLPLAPARGEADAAAASGVAFALARWTDRLNALSASVPSEDAELLTGAIRNTLSIAASVFLLTPADDVPSGPLRPRGPEYRPEDGYFHSGTCFLSDFGLYAQAEVTCSEAFLLVTLSMYEFGGTLMGIQRVELGLRDGEMMALLVDYDHRSGLTGRFAMYPRENDPRILYTRTIGKTLDLCLDVRAWAGGGDCPAWEKSLLLPAAVLYQDD